ncbi:hypothetical protein DFQ28_003342 [Apophysomyces sp. BC1034]|nr:hypothetical protein DFQ30_003040 [Apophysomyces sp. BC1015]KAG0189497.1 hypothetical protein DFQ28_003342 [Apophysomyces sp. BC1034]
MQRMNLCASSQCDPCTFFVAVDYRVLVYTIDNIYSPFKEPKKILESPNAARVGGGLESPFVINAVKVGNMLDEEILVTVSECGEICVWKTGALDKPPTILNNHSSTWGIAIHGEQGLIAVSANNFKITIFNYLEITRPGHQRKKNVLKEEKQIELEGHSHNIPNIDFSQSGRYIASCSIDKTCRVWDILKKKCITKRKAVYSDRETNSWGWSVKFVPRGSFKYAFCDDQDINKAILKRMTKGRSTTLGSLNLHHSAKLPIYRLNLSQLDRDDSGDLDFDISDMSYDAVYISEPGNWDPEALQDEIDAIYDPVSYQYEDDTFLRHQDWVASWDEDVEVPDWPIHLERAPNIDSIYLRDLEVQVAEEDDVNLTELEQHEAIEAAHLAELERQEDEDDAIEAAQMAELERHEAIEVAQLVELERQEDEEDAIEAAQMAELERQETIGAAHLAELERQEEEEDAVEVAHITQFERQEVIDALEDAYLAEMERQEEEEEEEEAFEVARREGLERHEEGEEGEDDAIETAHHLAQLERQETIDALEDAYLAEIERQEEEEEAFEVARLAGLERHEGGDEGEEDAIETAHHLAQLERQEAIDALEDAYIAEVEQQVEEEEAMEAARQVDFEEQTEGSETYEEFGHHSDDDLTDAQMLGYDFFHQESMENLDDEFAWDERMSPTPPIGTSREALTYISPTGGGWDSDDNERGNAGEHRTMEGNGDTSSEDSVSADEEEEEDPAIIPQTMRSNNTTIRDRHHTRSKHDIGEDVILTTTKDVYLLNTSKSRMDAIRVEKGIVSNIDVRSDRMDRLNMVEWIPELELFVAASQKGTVALTRMLQVELENGEQTCLFNNEFYLPMNGLQASPLYGKGDLEK